MAKLLKLTVERLSVGADFPKDLKVLFITGFGENLVLGNGVLEPGMQVMTKPFSLEAFTLRVRELLALE
jgi:hypothetical protein